MVDMLQRPYPFMLQDLLDQPIVRLSKNKRWTGRWDAAGRTTSRCLPNFSSGREAVSAVPPTTAGPGAKERSIDGPNGVHQGAAPAILVLPAQSLGGLRFYGKRDGVDEELSRWLRQRTRRVHHMQLLARLFEQ